MKNKKGFTLVELLVVIAIIGILSSVAVVNLNSARSKAKIASVQGSLAGLAAAGEIFANDNNDYTGFCNYSVLHTATTTAGASAGLVTTDFVCNDDAAGWALSVDMSDLQASEAYCISNTGSGDTVITTEIACP